MTGLRIVKASPNDLPDLVSLIHQFAAYMNMPVSPDLTAEKLRDILFAENAYAECFLAVQNENIMGFTWVEKTWSVFSAAECLHIKDLFINPAYQGKGYGREIMHFLAELAIRRGLAKLIWETRKSNKAAIAFYKNLGLQGGDDGLEFYLDKEGVNALLSHAKMK